MDHISKVCVLNVRVHANFVKNLRLTVWDVLMVIQDINANVEAKDIYSLDLLLLLILQR